jgi:hypothetical protein
MDYKCFLNESRIKSVHAVLRGIGLRIQTEDRHGAILMDKWKHLSVLHH